MEEYILKAQKAIEGKKETMPKHNGSVIQYQKRYLKFVELLKEADIILRNLLLDHTKGKDITSDKLDEYQKINKELLESYISHFKSNK